MPYDFVLSITFSTFSCAAYSWIGATYIQQKQQYDGNKVFFRDHSLNNQKKGYQSPWKIGHDVLSYNSNGEIGHDVLKEIRGEPKKRKQKESEAKIVLCINQCLKKILHHPHSYKMKENEGRKNYTYPVNQTGK